MYLSLSSGSMQSTFWKRTVINSSGSVVWRSNRKRLRLLFCHEAVRRRDSTCYGQRTRTFFVCPKAVTAEFFTEIHHTFFRHKALSAINTLVISLQAHTGNAHIRPAVSNSTSGPHLHRGGPQRASFDSKTCFCIDWYLFKLKILLWSTDIFALGTLSKLALILLGFILFCLKSLFFFWRNHEFVVKLRIKQNCHF